MSEEEELALKIIDDEWTAGELCNETAATIHRLIRERDEARAEASAYKASYETVHSEAVSLAANQCLHRLHGDAHGNPYCPGIAAAEQRGYRKGVEDAAKLADGRVNYYASVAAAEALYDCSKAILALPEPGEKK